MSDSENNDMEDDFDSMFSAEDESEGEDAGAVDLGAEEEEEEVIRKPEPAPRSKPKSKPVNKSGGKGLIIGGVATVIALSLVGGGYYYYTEMLNKVEAIAPVKATSKPLESRVTLSAKTPLLKLKSTPEQVRNVVSPVSLLDAPSVPKLPVSNAGVPLNFDTLVVKKSLPVIPMQAMQQVTEQADPAVNLLMRQVMQQAATPKETPLAALVMQPEPPVVVKPSSPVISETELMEAKAATDKALMKLDKVKAELKKVKKDLKHQSGRRWLAEKQLKTLKVQLKSTTSRGIFAGWMVMGISERGVALTNSQNDIKVLSVGETFEGVKILSVNSSQSRVVTSAGDLVRR